jgi:hypothetical protein
MLLFLCASCPDPGPDFIRHFLHVATTAPLCIHPIPIAPDLKKVLGNSSNPFIRPYNFVNESGESCEQPWQPQMISLGNSTISPNNLVRKLVPPPLSWQLQAAGNNDIPIFVLSSGLIFSVVILCPPSSWQLQEASDDAKPFSAPASCSSWGAGVIFFSCSLGPYNLKQQAMMLFTNQPFVSRKLVIPSIDSQVFFFSRFRWTMVQNASDFINLFHILAAGRT